MKLKEKKIIQGLIIFSILIVVTLSLFGDKGLLQLMELQRQETRLINEIGELSQEREDWINKIDSLKNNQTYIETIAREKLGMVRNEERIIHLRAENDL
jgi:cell division protein FtsB